VGLCGFGVPLWECHDGEEPGDDLEAVRVCEDTEAVRVEAKEKSFGLKFETMLSLD